MRYGAGAVIVGFVVGGLFGEDAPLWSLMVLGVALGMAGAVLDDLRARGY